MLCGCQAGTEARGQQAGKKGLNRLGRPQGLERRDGGRSPLPPRSGTVWSEGAGKGADPRSAGSQPGSWSQSRAGGCREKVQARSRPLRWCGAEGQGWPRAGVSATRGISLCPGSFRPGGVSSCPTSGLPGPDGGSAARRGLGGAGVPGSWRPAPLTALFLVTILSSLRAIRAISSSWPITTSRAAPPAPTAPASASRPARRPRPSPPPAPAAADAALPRGGRPSVQTPGPRARRAASWDT